jgi:hypothetical protein
MNKQQTAVEWLSEQFDSIVELYPSQFERVNRAINQAKEMEKEQKMKDYFQGRKDESSSKARHKYNRNSEQWYNETYGGNK